jgi:DedD protein
VIDNQPYILFSNVLAIKRKQTILTMTAAMKNSIQEYDPRHRLTGAVVLILLAIILLPMLLSKKPDVQTSDTDPVVMEITKEGKKVFVSRISSVTAKDSSESAAVKSSSDENEKSDKKENTDQPTSVLFKPLPSTTVKKSSTEKVQSPAASQPLAKEVTTKPSLSKPSPSKKTTATAADVGWILQVGVFSQPENASKKVSELKKKGFNAKSGKVTTTKGIVTKVWLGPFKDRNSAEKMQERLQHKTRQRGMVVKK